MALCDSVPDCSVVKCGRYYGSYFDRSTADGLYHLNNFDNLPSSYVTLFALMVVNNWHVIMQGQSFVQIVALFCSKCLLI